MVIAERGAGGQQHLEDAKEGLLEREGAGIGVSGGCYTRSSC